VSVEDLFARTRGGARVAFARQVAMYLIHVVYRLSISDIAVAFGRDRSTASYACHRIEDLREDPLLDRQLSMLERLLRGVTDLEGTP
jgi:chromosomal replication initiation ATPase DnaA